MSIQERGVIPEIIDQKGVLPKKVVLEAGLEMPVLTVRQREILQLTALGLSMREIGATLKITRPSVKYNLNEIHAKSNLSTLGLILTGLHTNLLDRHTIWEGHTPSQINSLTNREHDVMGALMTTKQNPSSNLTQYVADTLGCSPNTVKHHLVSVDTKLHTRNLTHSGAVYASYRLGAAIQASQ